MPASIPLFYRLVHFYLEPVFALNGAYQLLAAPRDFWIMLKPDLAGDPAQPFLNTHIAGSWAMLAFIEAMVLRATDDPRVWRWLLLGLIISDVFYMASFGWVFPNMVLAPWSLRQGDWVNIVGTVPTFATRVAFVLGVGMPRTEPPGREKMR